MLNRLRVSTKIIIPIVIILTVSNLITNYVTATKMHTLAKNSAKESSWMLSDSIFITLRNAMNTGDPAIIKHAEDDSRKNIKGLASLIVAKSQKTIDMYSPETKFTSDKTVIDIFSSKKEKVMDIYKNDSHFLRVLRPMIASSDCLMCHANQKEGDVIGVIDLTFSMDDADNTITETILFILIISLIFIVIILTTVWFVAKKTTQPLHKLQNELDEFFSFLAKERDTIEPFKVHSMDEIGEMVVSLNDNISKTIDGIKQDADAIKQSSIICEQVSKGNLKVKIETIANNPEINNLTKIVNNLISSLDYNINRILDTLNHYSKDEYDTRINSKGSTIGEIKELFHQVDHLGETLTELSGQNLQNGKALQQTSNVFSKNVQLLVTSSQEQAKSLNQTSDDLNEVTRNLQNTTQNTKKMLELATTVTQASNNGHQLAIKTETSMSNINEKVNAISTAITVIDQIAFQTNILSLNAAVEAATAGESGKGFAVVAAEVRNLASRSAEAAKEIKELVEDATSQAQDGSIISNEMIKGYEILNESIVSTTKLISSVTHDSTSQQQRIEEINHAISEVDKSTHNNVKIAEETNIVAQQASDIAHNIVADAGGKVFDGKDNIRIRANIINPNFNGIEKRKIEKSLKNNKK